ncbi:MAG: hypothetical protein OZ921_19005 [Sorangiineae bacterium]|nr:hypothetical protein [Polyangiaceae bacterium]MEB2324613.1 hypothetical protein [Sorangiineae bacterium]
MFESGYWQIARVRGIPIRLHWSLALGALLFGGFQFAPAFWVGFVVVVLVHEAGHALLVRRFGQRVLGIDITGFGGLTRWAGATTPMQRSIIAWGGVLAQGALLLLTLGALALMGPPRTVMGAELSSVLTRTNLWIIALNLLPLPPLDGALAWRLVPMLLERVKRARRARPRRTGTTPRRSSRGSAPPSPMSGDSARELAERFRRVGDQARDARNGR